MAGSTSPTAASSVSSAWRRVGGDDFGFCYVYQTSRNNTRNTAEDPIPLSVGSYFAVFPKLESKSVGRVTFSVEPQLPEGIELDVSTGVIEGTPCRASSLQRYTITMRKSDEDGEPPVESTVVVSLSVAGGKCRTVAGIGSAACVAQAAPKLGTKVALHTPRGLCCHRAQLYIGQHRSISVLSLITGEMQTLLGQPATEPGLAGDNMQKEHARVYNGEHLLIDDDAQELYWSDISAAVVRKVGLRGSPQEGLVSRVAGTGGGGYSGDGALATDATLSCPCGLAFKGNADDRTRAPRLYIADQGNHAIRMVNLENRRIMTVMKDEKLTNCCGLLLQGEHLYVAVQGKHRIMRIHLRDDGPAIETFAGDGDLVVDGSPAMQRAMLCPTHLVADKSMRHMYVTCQSSHSVLEIDMQQQHHPVRLVAGTGTSAAADNLISASASPLQLPYGVAFDVAEGTLLVTEQSGHRIRSIPVSPSPSEVPRAESSDSIRAACVSPALCACGEIFSVSFTFPGGGLQVPLALGLAAESALDDILSNSIGLDALAGCGFTMIPDLRKRVAKEVVTITDWKEEKAVRKVLRATNVLQFLVERRCKNEQTLDYSIRSITLNGKEASQDLQNFALVTPEVGADEPMHVFVVEQQTRDNVVSQPYSLPFILEVS